MRAYSNFAFVAGRARLKIFSKAATFCNLFGGIMKKNSVRIGALFAGLALSAIALSCSKSGAVKESTRIVIDHDDEKVVIPAKVKRAVVVGVWPLPSVITIFLGSPDKLVGIPPASIGAAKAGLLGELFPSYLNIDSHFLANDTLNVEEVLALKPDVVFTTAHRSQQKEEIKKAGLTAVAVSVNKWNYNILDTYDGWIDVLSQVFPENDKKDAVSAYSRKAYETIQSRVSSVPERDRKKVLFLFTCNEKTIVTSGKRFFGQFWCDAVGAKNVAEEVGAENSNAVQNRTVYKMPLGTYRSYTPSADTPVTLYWIAKKVYPELFGDIDVEKEVKAYFKDMYDIDLTDEQINRMYNQDSKGAAGTRGA